MKMGIVSLNLNYIVDLEDNTMVDYACDCLLEDISNMIKFNEHLPFSFKEDATLDFSDIPSFLIDEV